MKPLYTEEEFEKAKTKDKLPCQCYECKGTFYKQKKLIFTYLRKNKSSNQIKFCSYTCKNKSQETKQEVKCNNCNKVFLKSPYQIQKFPNHFCSKSCSSTYNNTHKKHGTRRSKIELYFEEELLKLYPSLHMDFNKKDAINSELDIYIPSLRLAVELNGIYHYEPIHGIDKLSQIQNNDQRKFQACLEKSIELILIDISSLNYFKKERANKFLQIITEIINKKL